MGEEKGFVEVLDVEKGEIVLSVQQYLESDINDIAPLSQLGEYALATQTEGVIIVKIEIEPSTGIFKFEETYRLSMEKKKIAQIVEIRENELLVCEKENKDL